MPVLGFINAAAACSGSSYEKARKLLLLIPCRNSLALAVTRPPAVDCSSADVALLLLSGPRAWNSPKSYAAERLLRLRLLQEGQWSHIKQLSGEEIEKRTASRSKSFHGEHSAAGDGMRFQHRGPSMVRQLLKKFPLL